MHLNMAIHPVIVVGRLTEMSRGDDVTNFVKVATTYNNHLSL